MYVVDTEASGIMESLVSGLYFSPRLLGLCIIVAEEEEEGRLCAIVIVMKVAFSFFNMECLWDEAMLSDNPTLELS